MPSESVDYVTFLQFGGEAAKHKKNSKLGLKIRIYLIAYTQPVRLNSGVNIA